MGRQSDYSLKPDRDTEYFIETQVKKIRAIVGNGKALCALSGGVDSSVAAVLVHRAIGDRLTCIFVDHGLLRKDETAQVENVFRNLLNVNILTIDAKKRFINGLKGITAPETKRKFIGNEFIRVFEEEARSLGEVDFLVQGTIQSDVVESGGDAGKHGDGIKSHHNVGGLPEEIELLLIEPLRTLYKNEVRKVGIGLGIPEHIVNRQPFPGPGLAIRIIGEVSEEKLEMLKEADAIVRQRIEDAGLDRDIWQYFAVLLNTKAVGIKNGKRAYENVIAIRAVQSIDGMKADWAKMPYEVLGSISLDIASNVPGISRVVYDITPKPPGTIEWE